MEEIKTIFSYADKTGGKHRGLAINAKTGELYWDDKKIVTERKLSLTWWVNAAIIIGALSTFALAIMQFYKIYNQMP